MDNNTVKKTAKTAEEKREDNARRNREMRARKGDVINADRKAKRDELKAIKSIKIDIITPVLKKATKLPPHSTAPKQDITKNKYISSVRAFYKKHTGDDLQDDADIIKKINEQPYKQLAVSKQFKPIITGNIKEIIKNPTQVKIIYIIFRGIRGFTDIEKQLEPYLKEYQRQYQANRSIIKANREDLERIDFNNKEEYEANLCKLEDIIDKVIYSYMMVLKMREGDLRIAKITTDKNDINNGEYNWIYDNKLYINKTKNKQKNIIELSDNLRFWNSIPSGYILGSLIPQPTLSQRIQRIFLKLYGKIYTARNIRHLYATQINNAGATLEERQKAAKQSGHSVMEQLSYVYRVATPTQ
jgi:hypothetical protein